MFYLTSAVMIDVFIKDFPTKPGVVAGTLNATTKRFPAQSSDCADRLGQTQALPSSTLTAHHATH
jgi:hypothetical protein